MKKFNSILAIATVALSAVFGLTSCEKNDEVFEQPVQPRIESHTVTTTVPTDNNESTYTSESKSATTVKDVIGTYKYTSEDGKEWVIEMTENPGNKENQYCASVTVPEGSGVEAKAYEGQYRIGNSMATFYSNEKAGGTYNYSVVGFGLKIDKENPNNVTVIFKLNGELAQTLVFTKQ